MNVTVQLDTDLEDVRQQINMICRRRSKRVHFAEGAIKCLLFQGDGTSHAVWLDNISERGIGFCMNWPLDHGTSLILKIANKKSDALRLQAKVVRTAKQPAGGWLIGCEFATP